MPKLVLDVPADVNALFRRYPDVKWEAVVRAAVARKLGEVAQVERILSRSRFTAKDAERLGRKVKRNIHKRYAKMFR